jgi:tripartite-type tricarboxylate transporter receptor subunit TctC
VTITHLGHIMKLPHRRQFLHLAAVAAALPVLSRIARAEAYPTRPVRIIVPFGTGGGTDILARVIGQWLSERIGQQFFVENRPGAGGNIGTETVTRAAPDGHTLLITDASPMVNAALYGNLGFDFTQDLAPVANILRAAFIIVVNPAMPAKTLSEFLDFAKANPGKINMASSGTGTMPHMAGEQFKMMAGVDMVHVPYRSIGAAVTDLIGGQVHVLFIPPPAVIEHVRAGRLRAIGVTSLAPLDAAPDVQRVSELVPGFEASNWYGVTAPRKTPAAVVAKLNEEINAGLNDPKLRARLIELGGAVTPGSPADYGRLIANETEKWGKVIRAANIKAE